MADARWGDSGATSAAAAPPTVDRTVPSWGEGPGKGRQLEAGTVRRSSRRKPTLPVEVEPARSPRGKRGRSEGASAAPERAAPVSLAEGLLSNPEVTALISDFQRYGRPRWFTPGRSIPRGVNLEPHLSLAQVLETLTGQSASLGRVVSDREHWRSALDEFCSPGMLQVLQQRVQCMYADPVECGIALAQSHRESRMFIEFLVATMVTPYTDHPFATVSKWLELVCDYLSLSADELVMMLIYLTRYIVLNAEYPLERVQPGRPSPPTQRTPTSTAESDMLVPDQERSADTKRLPPVFHSEYERPLFRPVNPLTSQLIRACDEPRAQLWEQVLAVTAYTAVFTMEEFPRRTELELRDLLGNGNWSMRDAQVQVYRALDWRLVVCDTEFEQVRDLVLQGAIQGEASATQLLEELSQVVREERRRLDEERDHLGATSERASVSVTASVQSPASMAMDTELTSDGHPSGASSSERTRVCMETSAAAVVAKGDEHEATDAMRSSTCSSRRPSRIAQAAAVERE
ncbi:hypothetical protein CDCA_CDCA02G0638 [Cyanidium caldarium]|uniref:Uncharacterized protein n=1 Tax=Cyanidium caldarium TaxID=2771 RepID=A0AAV9IQS9_CYACA|nr:hypothetical protein CDCA_CDCA02G0638 [Cyanidium caldarium]